MSDPVIMFIKPGAISQSDKDILRDSGIIVIEIENPSDAKLVRAGTELSSSEILQCAIRAIKDYKEPEGRFGAAMCAAIAAMHVTS